MPTFDEVKQKAIDFLMSGAIPKTIGSSLPDAASKVGQTLFNQFIYDPVTKKVLPSSLYETSKKSIQATKNYINNPIPATGDSIQPDYRAELTKQMVSDMPIIAGMTSPLTSLAGKSKDAIAKTASKLFSAEGNAAKQLTSGVKQLPYKFDEVTKKVLLQPPQGGVQPIPQKVAKTITGVDSTINLKRDVPIKDVHGQKATLPAGEAYTAYNTSDNKIVLKDGETFVVNKNQYQNVKGNALKSGVPQDFAPELKGVEETIRGDKGYADIIRKKQGIPDGELVDVPLTKYHQYTLPGGENYREVLIKAPAKLEGAARQENADKIAKELYGKTHRELWDSGKMDEWNKVSAMNKTEYGNNFKSGHWEEPNVLAHVRLNDRLTPDGKKVTFMEEMQSDWAREGRKTGFKQRTENPERLLPEGWSIKTNGDTWRVVDSFGVDVPNKLGDGASYGGSKNVALGKALGDETLMGDFKGGIPNHHLLKDWQKLSIKRALKDAVDNGSDYFAWTTGEQQQARYDLSKQLDRIDWGAHPYNQGEKQVSLIVKNGENIKVAVDKNNIIKKVSSNKAENWIGKNINEAIGKGIGEKIGKTSNGTLSGEGFNIGGEWAKKLYDEQLPNMVKDITGVKPEIIKLPTGKVMATYEDLPRHLQKLVDYLDMGKISQQEIQEIAKKDGFEFDFDMSGELNSITNLKEMGNQQAIRITPELKAKILGQEVPLKKPSGQAPQGWVFDPLFNKVVPK